MEERRHNYPQSMSDDDVQRIANAIAARTHAEFLIDAELHYNSHKELDRLLTAYETASNIFWKYFLSLIILGAIVLAGIGIAKGVK